MRGMEIQVSLIEQGGSDIGDWRIQKGQVVCFSAKLGIELGAMSEVRGEACML